MWQPSRLVILQGFTSGCYVGIGPKTNGVSSCAREGRDPGTVVINIFGPLPVPAAIEAGLQSSATVSLFRRCTAHVYFVAGHLSEWRGKPSHSLPGS